LRLYVAPRPPPTLSQQQIVSLTQSSCVSPVELTDGRGGRGSARSQIIRPRESLALYNTSNTFRVGGWGKLNPSPFPANIFPAVSQSGHVTTTFALVSSVLLGPTKSCIHKYSEVLILEVWFGMHALAIFFKYYSIINISKT
jgi:hypothetical protein